MERELAGGESHVYRASVSAGRPLLVRVEQRGIDVVVAAVGPAGRELPPIDSPNGRWGPEILVLEPDPPGEYRVEVRSPANAAPGRYRLSVAELGGDKPVEGQRRTAFLRMTEGARRYREGTAESRRRAIASFAAALEIWRSLGQAREEAETSLLLGAAYRSLGEPRPALDFYRQSLARWPGLGEDLAEPAGEARALVGIGLVQWELGDNAAAREALSQSLQLFQEAGDRASATAARNNLCLLQLSAGELAAALPCFQAVLAEFKALGQAAGEAAALNSLGGVYDELGEPLRAREHYTQALALYREAQDRRGESQALNNLAGIEGAMGDTEQALAAYGQALDLFRGLGDRLHEGNVLNNLGFLYIGLGEPERARPYLEQALALRRQLGDRRGEAVSLNNLGLAFARLGDLTQAVELHGQALTLAEEVEDRGNETAALELLSRARLEQGEVQAALQTLERALPLTRAMGDRSREALVLQQLGRAQAAGGQNEAALASLAQALELHRAVGDPVRQVETLQELARLEHRLGQDENAWTRLDAALDLLESFRARVPAPDLRASFLAAGQGVFELAIELRMSREAQAPRQGFVRQAFEISERARARSLLDLLGEAAAQVRQGIDPDLLRREREIQQRLNGKAIRQTRLLSGSHTAEQEAQARQELESLRAEADEIAAEIRRRSPRYAALTRLAPLDTAAVQALLDPQTLLLEIQLGEPRSFLWRVGTDSVTGFALPGRGVIEAQAAELYQALRAPGEGAAAAAGAAALARLVLGPVAGTLGDRRLVIVADGALQLIPFAVLPDPSTPDEPLLVRHEIVSIPSASVLAVQRRELAGRPPAPKTLAVLADPVFAASDSRLASLPDAAARGGSGASGFSRLPATRREAEAIAALVPAGQLLAALDFRASRATAEGPELGQYRIVHFATHGVLDTRAPELSGLVLSLVGEDGRPRDGFLGLGDIYNLRLGADLVVLSGCETALGRQVRGEGLVGLSQAFFYAGARRIVASLWRVQDRSTAELMARFYRGLLAERLSPAAALRQAQLAVRRDPRWREPYHWGPFLLEGDWR